MIPHLTDEEAAQRCSGRLLQWDPSIDVGLVKLDKAVRGCFEAELLGCDLRNPATLRVGMHVEFQLGIDPEQQCLRCNDVTQTEDHASDRSKDDAEIDDSEEGSDMGEECRRPPVCENREFFLGSDSETVKEMLQEEEPDPKIEGLKEVMELTKSGRPRKLLIDWGPRTGHIRLWKDRLGEGWIEPDEPIDDDSLHPSGWVWFYDREASESLTLKNVVNLPVKFMLYMQNFRLGAAFVTLLEEPKERREHSSPSPQRCQRAREEWREDEENCIKRRRIGDEDGEEVGEDEHEYPENGAFAWSPEEEDGEAQEEHRVKQEEESLQKAAPKQRPPHLRPVSKPVSKPVRPVPGDGHENAKSLLQREVREVMKILGEQETLWSTSELAKRTVKYFDRGLNAAKDHDDWHVAAEKFMRSSLGSFSAACNSRSWFPDAEDFLKPILHNVSWELIQDCDNASECSPDLLQELVETCYEKMLDEINFDRSIRDAVRRSFGHLGKEIEGKVVTALTRTHEGAVKGAQEAAGSSMRKIEAFVKTWMNQSMDRASIMIKKWEELVTEDSILELFKLLLAPDISESYTCVPRQFRSPKGRPPRNWNYLRPCVRDLLGRWTDIKATSKKSVSAPEKNGDSVDKPLPRRAMPAALRAL